MNYFEIGKIVNTQGLRGEVRVVPTTDDPARFQLLSDVIVSLKHGDEILVIESVRYHKQFVILKFKGIDHIDDAGKLKNSLIKIPPELALPLEENEYYIRDLIGLNVYTADQIHIGTITDVLPTGANDVYAIAGQDGKTIYIPAISQCVLAVDIPGRKMTVRLLEGL